MGTLAELAGRASVCTACPELVASRSGVVVGTFPEGARVLLVGEAPGAEEDTAGVPFVGRSGKLLNELLAAAGLERDQVAVTNVAKCRPPRNRKPAAAEVERCRHWLERQVELAEPRVVCALGGTAAAWALGRRSVRLASERERVHECIGRPLVVTYHPSAAIRGGRESMQHARLREDLGRLAELAG